MSAPQHEVLTWKSAPHADEYIPTLNYAEQYYSIPHDLLARVAYQESHFRTDIVEGALRSSDGCIGLMQLNPKFFANAGEDWISDVYTAAAELKRLHQHFNRWRYALMAYNWGQGHVDVWLEDGMVGAVPQETQDYVNQITAAVPIDDGD